MKQKRKSTCSYILSFGYPYKIISYPSSNHIISSFQSYHILLLLLFPGDIPVIHLRVIPAARLGLASWDICTVVSFSTPSIPAARPSILTFDVIFQAVFFPLKLLVLQHLPSELLVAGARRVLLPLLLHPRCRPLPIPT